MKIAIATSGKTLDSLIDPRFGRCPYFLIIDSETKKFKVLNNKAGQAFRGAGISAAQMIANEKVKIAIAGNFGPKAIDVLNASGIDIFTGVSGITVEKALEKYKAGKLQKLDVATMAPRMQRGLGMGQGCGWDRGRK